MRIEHRLGVATPPYIIWEVLFDLAAWPQWTTIYPKAEGTIRFGGQLNLTLALPGQAERAITPTVFDWTPDELIHWRESEVFGLSHSVRYLEIEKLSDTGCIFSNGEIFKGPLGLRLNRHRARGLRQGYAALGEAMKLRAEALWAQRQAEAGVDIGTGD